MNGWPVWLASLSTTDRITGKLIPTERWDAERRAWGRATLDLLLEGLGDATRQREFRMCATLCRHRALTDAEAADVPAEWFNQPGEHLAGGSLEVLWETVPGAPSTQPCHDPGRDPVGPGLFLPIDCGRCPPCLARADLAVKP